MRIFDLGGLDLTSAMVRGVKAMFKWAVDPDVCLIRRNPFDKLKTPCGERGRTLRRPELARLYAHCRGPFRRFVFVMAHTLARPAARLLAAVSRNRPPATARYY